MKPKIAKKSLPVGHPAPPNLAAMTKEEQTERQQVIERLHELTRKAKQGEEGAMPALKKILDEHPDLAWRLGDFARSAENALIGELYRNRENPVTEEAIRRQFAAMREEIAEGDASPLERLLAERVVSTWMQVQIFEGLCTGDLRNPTSRLADYHQRHLDRAHKRHLSAIRTLAQIRKLDPTVQINIADKQINTAG